MEDNKHSKDQIREFWLSSFAIENSTSVMIVSLIIVVFGLVAYVQMPKAQFPDIKIPTVYVNTIYPGNSPVDIENLITRHIEKQLKTIKGVKKINSTSAQDVSAIVIEFNEDVQISKALQDVKDGVDKSKKDLPTDLDNDPQVLELDFSEIPIVVINLSGDFEVSKLQEYAEYLEDELEALTEVSKVEITGSLDREIQINADLYKMDAMKVTFADVESSIANENMTMSGGEILTSGFRRSLRISGEFQNVEQIKNTIVKSEEQNSIFLKDIAEVKDSYIERKSYARLATNEFAKKGNFPVVSLKVIKKSGENLINADQKIRVLLEQAKKGALPPSLAITFTDNQADGMKAQIDNLENNIISGVILVVGVLLFFMGLRNALFVGIAIPLSMLMSFMILSAMGYSINVVILFGLILALGMLVDNGIVVVENIYRLMENGYSASEAARKGTGEVAIPIISSTATTLAAFFPLVFWGGILGEFMKYLPITLIVVLSSSLFVGLVINPVLAALYMQVSKSSAEKPRKTIVRISLAMITLSIPSYFLFDTFTVANLLMFFGGMGLLNVFFLRPASDWFQKVLLVKLENLYLRLLRFALNGSKPYLFFAGTVGILIFSIMIFAMNSPMVILFPESDPLYIYVVAETPLGTDVKTMNEVTKNLEKEIFKRLTPYTSIVKSIVTNIGQGTRDPNDGPGSDVTPHKARISIGFVDFQYRGDFSTKKIMQELTQISKTMAGVKITVDKNRDGPPVGKPVSIELVGLDYLKLIQEAEKLYTKIDQAKISGLSGLKIELETGKPELLFEIDRAKARRYGLSTGTLAMNLRTALYGKEISKLKDGEDDYPIQLRLDDKYRYNLASLVDQRITFRDNRGTFHQVPVSAVADLKYSSTFGSVKRKDLDKLVVVSSNVIEGYNPNQVVEQVKQALAGHKMPEGYAFRFGGEQEEQAKSLAFLSKALLIAVCAITLILVSQFNSIIKPFIIMCSVIFSTIGVFLGLTAFSMDFVIVMTGIGIISLAGVVVNNAIVLIDYTTQLQERKLADMGLSKTDSLSKADLIDCLVEAGYTRLRPVLLTAITTVLGLIPLATGFNFDFFGFFARFEPSIYAGGDNAAFWGPMSWTVIFGLTFATFLTLVVVPVMYLLTDNIVKFFKKIFA